MAFTNATRSLELGKQFAELLKQAKIILLGNKMEAVTQLAETIDEIQKFYFALNEEISDFLSISFSDGNNHSLNKKKLLDLQNGIVSVRIQNARGHCGKIQKIYHDHLETWFNKVFRSDSTKVMELTSLFNELTEYDKRMLFATDEVSKYLSTKATEILKFVKAEDNVSAKKLIDEAEVELSPLIKAINALLADLTALKNSFSET